jgi:hypothetical protein
MVAVLASAARGQARFGPVGGAIAGAGVGRLDTGFHHPGVETVTVPPIAADAPGRLTKDMRREMFHPHRGQDQEAAVADDTVQIRCSPGVGPARPGIAGSKAAAETEIPPSVPCVSLTIR